MNSPKPLAIRLYPEEVAALEAIAANFESIARTSQNAGNPSWRTLIKDIANGRLTVTEPKPR